MPAEMCCIKEIPGDEHNEYGNIVSNFNPVPCHVTGRSQTKARSCCLHSCSATSLWVLLSTTKRRANARAEMCCFVKMKSRWKGKHPTAVKKLQASVWFVQAGTIVVRLCFRELLPSSDFFHCVLLAKRAHLRLKEMNCNILGSKSKVALSWRSLGWRGHVKRRLDSTSHWAGNAFLLSFGPGHLESQVHHPVKMDSASTEGMYTGWGQWDRHTDICGVPGQECDEGGVRVGEHCSLPCRDACWASRHLQPQDWETSMNWWGSKLTGDVGGHAQKWQGRKRTFG